MEIIVTTNLQYFFCQNSMKVYSEPLEQDMKSIDAADIKL